MFKDCGQKETKSLKDDIRSLQVWNENQSMMMGKLLKFLSFIILVAVKYCDLLVKYK